LKTLVANSAGGVGKSFITEKVLKEIAKDAKIIEISEKEIEDFDDYLSDFFLLDSLITDIPSRYNDAFFKNFSQYGAFEYVDSILIPVVLNEKELKETFEFIESLKEKTDLTKAVVIFNKIPSYDVFEIEEIKKYISAFENEGVLVNKKFSLPLFDFKAVFLPEGDFKKKIDEIKSLDIPYEKKKEKVKEILPLLKYSKEKEFMKKEIEKLREELTLIF